MRDFKKLMIWQLGMEIVEKVYGLVVKFPIEERYGLRSQMTRSAVSIASNIAEGSAKKSDKDNARSCQIALGSAFELETQALMVRKLGWVDESEVDSLLRLIEEEQRKLSRFLDSLGNEDGNG